MAIVSVPRNPRFASETLRKAKNEFRIRPAFKTGRYFWGEFRPTSPQSMATAKCDAVEMTVVIAMVAGNEEDTEQNCAR